MSRIALVSFLSTLALSPACNRDGEVAHLPATTSAAAQAASTQPATAPTAAASSATPAKPVPAGDAAGEVPAPPPGSTFFSGQTEAHRKSTLTPKVSSAVTRVHVRDGDFVKTGQALVTLDTRDFVLRLQQAQAALQSAKVQLDSAKLDWNRTKSLLDEKAVPQSQFDMVDARYKGAQAGVLQAETAVAMGKKALQDATVHAPFSGLIIKRMVNEGEYASVMPATPLVVIEESDPLDLRVQVASTEVAKVKVGDLIRARFPATGQTVEARLTRVVSSMDPRTRTFSAIAELPNKDRSLRSGLYAEVTLVGTPGPDQTAASTAKPAAKRPALAAKSNAAVKPATKD